MTPALRKPDWLRAKLPSGPGYQATRRLVDDNRLHTVCQSAQCPNIGECWSRGTATVMILGNICTRSCNFCAIQTGRPTEHDLGEPARVADAVARMGLRHCVITSVARDDLADGGAGVWAATIRATKYLNPQCAIEVLVPDFKGHLDQVDTVLDAKPDIFNHNVETVERLQKPVRVQARYDRSRGVLRHAKGRGFTTKTGIMLGLGERREEIEQCLRDIASDKTDILTLGQYLQPTPQHWKIDRWVTPDEFRHWKEYALGLGIGVVESGPLVRSSYHADEQSAKYVGPEHLNVRPTLAST
ncbi:MAG TPA: lipoyl synthase [Lacunisphaera sp.]|jgi:lipoic acid synthetase|nr:lipoyl synthase [Lacunisphaera sp.]